MIAALVIALTSFVVYAFLAGCAPALADDLGIAYGIVMLVAWGYLAVVVERRRR